MHSDNRRLILDSEVNHSMSEVLLDSKPLTDTNQADNLRDNLVTLVKLLRKVCIVTGLI
jgi:hypothetical protein